MSAAGTSGDDAAAELEALRAATAGGAQAAGNGTGHPAQSPPAAGGLGESVKAVLMEGVDADAFIRAAVVIAAIVGAIALLCVVRAIVRRRRRLFVYGGQSRRYDALSAKQLQPELVVDSDDEEDSDSELFNSAHHGYRAAGGAGAASDTIRLVKTGEAEHGDGQRRQPHAAVDLESPHRRHR